jgi:hypothetical protein
VKIYVGFIEYMKAQQYTYIFHADLHPGNIMFSIRNPTEMTVIDWGRVVKIERPEEKKDALVLLEFYKLRQTFLDREDELLLACRIGASNPEWKTSAKNAALYFYWLDTFYVPQQKNISIPFKFSNIYRWILGMEKLMNEMKNKVLDIIEPSVNHSDQYVSTLSYRVDFNTKSYAWKTMVSESLKIRYIVIFMEELYCILRSCFNDNDIATFLKKVRTREFQESFNLFLSNITTLITEAIAYVKSFTTPSFIQKLYTNILLRVSDPMRARLDPQSCFSIINKTELKTFWTFLSNYRKYKKQQQQLQQQQQQQEYEYPPYLKDWAKHFGVTLPLLKELPRLDNTRDIKALNDDFINSTLIPPQWTTAIQDMESIIMDQTIYPLSDTSTFMRIFDAFQRLEQTLQVTWDKVRPIHSRRGAPTITQFLSGP